MLLPDQPRRVTQGGFTLVELLLVMAVLAILASMGFGVASGVSDARARTRVRAELAVLAQALEQFKLRHGDYPPAAAEPLSGANAADLLAALTGGKRLRADGSGGHTLEPADPAAPALLDPAVMETAKGADGNPMVFLDPWGQPYCYLYAPGSAGWENFGYLLLCHGPDGETVFATTVVDTGLLGAGFTDVPENRDTILLGQ